MLPTYQVNSDGICIGCVHHTVKLRHSLMVLRLVDAAQKKFVGAFKFPTDPTGYITDTQKDANEMHCDKFC
jgi:hypothetical protein